MFTKNKIARTKRSNELSEKVEQEIEFLKSLPEEEAAIRKIKKDRKTAWAIERAAKRAYKGPPLLTQKAIKA